MPANRVASTRDRNNGAGTVQSRGSIIPASNGCIGNRKDSQACEHTDFSDKEMAAQWRKRQAGRFSGTCCLRATAGGGAFRLRRLSYMKYLGPDARKPPISEPAGWWQPVKHSKIYLTLDGRKCGEAFQIGDSMVN